MAAGPRGVIELNYGAEVNAACRWPPPTLWDIARIELSRQDFARAAPLIAEAYQIVDGLGRLDGICTIGVTWGQMLAAAGDRERGLTVLRRSQEGFLKLGRASDAAQVAQLIAAVGGASAR